MRVECDLQTRLFDSFADHRWADALKAISEQLDQMPEIVSWVAEDVCTGTHNTGPQGISAESALRIGVVMRIWDLTYEKASFHLRDSLSMRAFTRLRGDCRASKSAVWDAVSRITAATWKRISDRIVVEAARQGVERGRKVRIDSTVSQAHIEAPSDSRLLCKSIEIMNRELKRGQSWSKVEFRNCTRAATRRQMEIQYGRGQDQRKEAYRKLIALTVRTLRSLEQMVAKVNENDPEQATFLVRTSHYIPLIQKVIEQTRRRVLKGESVPVDEKLVSLFEPHVDIIRKGGRETYYGHKINLVTGASALILDLEVERGNPADSARFIPMIERQCEIYGRPPRQIAADGGYASRQNLDDAKALGVKDVAFCKRKKLKITEMAKSHWVYRQLKKFRANIEAQIANLKNSFGVKRVRRRGWEGFRAYVLSATVAYNLSTLVARLAET